MTPNDRATSVRRIDAGVIDVRSGKQLIALATPLPWRWHRHVLALRFEDVAPALQRAAERRLNHWLSVCGCQTGALSVLATLAWLMWGSPQAVEWTFVGVLTVCGIVLGAGIAGKIVTILSARILFIADALFFARRIRHGVQPGRLTP